MSGEVCILASRRVVVPGHINNKILRNVRHIKQIHHNIFTFTYVYRIVLSSIMSLRNTPATSSRSCQSQQAESHVKEMTGCRHDGDQRSDDGVSEPVPDGADSPNVIAYVTRADELVLARNTQVIDRGYFGTVAYHAVVWVHHFLQIARRLHSCNDNLDRGFDA